MSMCSEMIFMLEYTSRTFKCQSFAVRRGLMCQSLLQMPDCCTKVVEGPGLGLMIFGDFVNIVYVGIVLFVRIC